MEEVQAVEEVKAGAEVALEAFVEKAYEPLADALVIKLKELIPGESFDGIVDVLGMSLKPVVKAALLAQIEKISDKV
jgi:hypothetical protein